METRDADREGGIVGTFLRMAFSLSIYKKNVVTCWNPTFEISWLETIAFVVPTRFSEMRVRSYEGVAGHALHMLFTRPCLASLLFCAFFFLQVIIV